MSASCNWVELLQVSSELQINSVRVLRANRNSSQERACAGGGKCPVTARVAGYGLVLRLYRRLSSSSWFRSVIDRWSPSLVALLGCIRLVADVARAGDR